MLRFAIVSFILLLSHLADAQKSLFVIYNVEQGLGQSQATDLVQDSFHNLWVSHLGGISRFDGKHFRTYTTADGLQSNFCNTISIDKKENIWIGTHVGLSVYDGHVFKNFELSKPGHSSVVLSIQCDRNNRVWALADGEIYEADTTQCKKANTPFSNDRVLAMGLDRAKSLLIAVEGKGIIKFEDKVWKPLYPLNFVDQKELTVRRIYTGPSGALYLVSNKGVFIHENNNWQQLSLNTSKQVQATNILEDEQGRIWVATTKGVYLVSNHMITHFDTGKGFSDHRVSGIVRDTEGNFWFSTIGSGIIKYPESRVLYFDKELLKNVGVSGITKTSDGSIWFGTYGGGLRRYDGKSLKEYRINAQVQATGIINFCFADNKDGIWTGTQGGGLWYLKNGIFKEVIPYPAVENRAYFSGHQGDSGRVIFSTYHGVYEYANDRLQPISNKKMFANTAAFIGDDSILVGTPQGIQLLFRNQTQSFPSNKSLSRATVLSIVRHKDIILVGTADKGLFTISLPGGQIKQFDVRHGLSSDCIYAIAVDPLERIWLSTGYFLNYFKLDDRGNINELKKIGKSKGILSPEGNTNSLFADDTVVWAGNISGLNQISLRHDRLVDVPLKVLITGVQLFSAEIPAGKFATAIRRYYPVPEDLRLPYNKNHLTFTFHAVSLTDPDEVFYQYRIKGIDRDFSQPAANNQVVFSSLPPGKHVLQVKAVNLQGNQSPVTEYSFTILTPFYQLWYFQAFVAALAFCLAAFLVHLRNQRKEMRKKEKEEIKKQEQLRVRRRTAEDFHDDIGTKLTRINVLTEVLKSKAQVNEEAKGLIEQIQENTSGLYSSSKDLIWSLSNDEGTLHDLAARLIHFGKSLFQNTGIVFEYSDRADDLNRFLIEPEKSRNITLIIKEALNNVLKHANATKVSLTTHLQGNKATITVRDNGKGYSLHEISSNGYGFRNMRTRAERIGVQLKQVSSPGGGASVILHINLPDNY